MTFAEWDACVAAGGCNGYRPGDQGWGRGRRPVINVSWEDAQAFVRVARGEDGEALPAADRGGVGVRGAGGDDDAVLDRRDDLDRAGQLRRQLHLRLRARRAIYREQTVAVDDPAFPANPFGLYHVHGNVWEWVQDCYRDSYDGAPLDGSIAVEG